jgi:hypothetical protein
LVFGYRYRLIANGLQALGRSLLVFGKSPMAKN